MRVNRKKIIKQNITILKMTKINSTLVINQQTYY